MTKQHTHSYLRQIDQAIIEYGRMSCPESECSDILTSKEYKNANAQPIIEYRCRNKNCSFHTKRKIFLKTEPKVQVKKASRQSFQDLVFGLVPGFLYKRV